MAAQSPAALLGPCIERISQGASGRKYNKLRQDAKVLLDKLGTMFVLQQAPPPAMGGGGDHAAPDGAVPATPARQSVAEPAAASPASVAAPGSAADQEAGEQVAVSLEHGEDGEVSFKLTLSPSKAAVPPEEAHTADPGHMPSSPAAGSTSRSATSRRSDAALHHRPGALHDGAARELLSFLRDAVDTRKAPLMEVALDCIQKLISFKLLQGPVHHINHRRDSSSKKKDDEEAGPVVDFDSLPPQAQAVELACRCDDVSDDAVELRLLKALLTAVTSTTLAVHGQALLLVVRACYNIFLTSRSDVNQATAKATLTQMLNVVFQRMEAGSCHVVVPPIVVSDLLGLPPADASNMSAFVQQFLYDVITTVDPFGTVALEIQQGLDDAFATEAPVLGEGELGDEDLLDPSDPTDRQQIHWRRQGGGEDGGSEHPQQAQQQQQAHHAASEASPAAGNGVSPAVSSGALGEAGYAASAASDLTSATAALALSEHRGGSSGKVLSMPAQLQKDAFLVFRALCKLSIRSTEASPGSEITTLRGKVLALELLKILLENSGPLFRSTERFVTAIKQYLCLSLLKNCQSAVPAALRLCCSIFLTLMTKFRKSLKAEIGVFFPMILLRPIEPAVLGATPNAAGAGGGASAPVDIAHKAVVLRCLQAQCEDGQLLVDLFVNYDCDLEGANLFERCVTALVRISQGSLAHEQGAGAHTPLEEQAIRYEALRCLVSLLKSLAAWHKNTTAVVAPAGSSGTPAAAAAGAAVAGGADGTAGEEVTAGAGDESMLEAGWMEKVAESGLAGSASEGVLPASGAAGAAAAGGEGDQRQVALLESWKGYKRQWQQGISLFNAKPKKGVGYMQEQGLVGAAPEDVALFLTKTQGLNKTLIGDYLGERDDFNLRVMHCYVDALAFEGMDFDEAIRKFLSGFRLPGEAQKIDRLMEKFAERFVSCNPESFKSADVAYVLAYSVIMLNTDAHNTQVKIKMSKNDFLRNNRGINDGGDLPQDFMEALYDRIITNEIKMKDDPMGLAGAAAADAEAAKAAAGAGWLDTIMNLIPGRAKAASAEPNDDAIRRTHEHLREKAKGATFFEAHDGEAIRPMLDVAWAPLLGAFSVLFEEYEDEYFVGLCLEGFISSVWLTSLLDVEMLRNTFVTSLARFTMLHSPASMRLKHARAFRALLVVAEQNGNYLRECWTEVLRCVSRFELLQQLTAGVPTDALLFAMPDKLGASAADKLKRRIMPRRKGQGEEEGGLAHDSVSSIQNMGLHASTREVDKKHLPPADVMASVDVQELNRLFVNSGRLDSDAIVHFVKTLSAVAREELRPVACPRVFSLAKIVEIAHFNMGRIRLVWTRIWAVLADFFIDVGCHTNLSVAMYAVDSLRQLAMKFLERDELANFSFQNDFLRPFVVVMRHSRAVEIRELIIRCVSQMVLARVANVKSGWKSMFMVFTTAASDESPQIVRLAFDTVEKIVREHFHFITETETTTFTDCVNCLIAFTNNPHSLDVSLNAIAFLRFCALALAEGDIGDVEELPEGSMEAAGRHMDPNAYRIRPTGSDAASPMRGPSAQEPDLPSPLAPNGAAAPSPRTAALNSARGGGGGRIRFTDKDEHMYFWFPLLAGLSELTFDPRPEIRYSALEVLFDILKYHGSSFSPQFWLRVFDSVLLPIFDHVRAEVTDTTTFTDDKRRAEVDSWLYDTCTRTLQHIVDIVVQYYAAVTALLDRILELLLGFVQRTHQALAGVGVAAMVRLIVATGPQLDEERWMMMLQALSTAAGDTLPNVSDLIQHRMTRRTHDSSEYEDAGGGSSDGLRQHFGVQSPPAAVAAAVARLRGSEDDSGGDGTPRRQVDRRSSIFSLGGGAGARRLAEVHVRSGIQLLLVQACSEVYAQHSKVMPPPAAVLLLDTLKGMASHAAAVDADAGLRHSLLLAQAADKVPPERALSDPPLLRLEAEASQAYLSVLLHVQAAAPEAVRAACALEARLTQLCLRNLERFEQQAEAAEEEAARSEGQGGAPAGPAVHSEENRTLAPLAVATLRALLAFSPDAFRAHLKDFFPLLTALISCEYAPPEVQRALSELFAKRIGPMLAS